MMKKRGAPETPRPDPVRGRPFRLTRQRQVILEELRKVRTHPTAAEVYAMVRRRLPHISLGTVYRNLDLLSAAGEIQTLELAGTQKRFDGNPADHYHARCLKCGRVVDLDLPSGALTDLEETVATVSGFKIVGHRLEFRGICPRCQPNRRLGRPKNQEGEPWN